MEGFNIKFVGEVEKHPELYDHTLPEYSRKDCTEKAWNEVAREVHLTVADCKEKWRNLRSTLAKNLKPKASGSGVGKKRQYYLHQAMQFTIPFIKIAGTPSGNLPEIPQPRSSPPPPSEFPVKEEPLQEIELSEDLRTEPGNPCDPPIRKRKHLSDDAEKAYIEYITMKKSKITNTSHLNERREGIQNFLNSLIPDLMQMNDVQLRIYKRKALLLIDEVMGTSPEVYHSGTSVIQSYQGTATHPHPQSEFIASSPSGSNFSVPEYVLPQERIVYSPDPEESPVVLK